MRGTYADHPINNLGPFLEAPINTLWREKLITRQLLYKMMRKGVYTPKENKVK